MFKSAISGMRVVVALLLFVSAQVFAADGTVRNVSGGVFVNSTPAVVGTEVNNGDSLSTGPGAWAIVVMSDGTVLNLKSDTKVEISNYVYDTRDQRQNNSDVELGIGTLRYVSGLIADNDPSDVAIRAGNTTLGLRGSEVEVDHTGPGGTTTAKGISGDWASKHPNRSPRNFGAGETDTTDDSTGSGDTKPTSPGNKPSDEQGGKETGNLAKQDKNQRGDKSTTGDTEADTDADAPAILQAPARTDLQSPVFSDDPANTGDPNAGG